ncbi:hypothetical protein COEREDRAFT_12593 [Coemansia reversa NRRL 1564]|uniref:Uncharacterized protein n=1 Tax=Coemansia reversa (strain ATCC 12441 / NRRL 1564) TaxID=763665 RepID=A0A2G5B0L4_COERN|nr:hypothetical protein COEREDRAFT_12593 [Coemansia reversa NRRL 1564]|eukprot:PIA12565.1 hypothetical protein COEREDRAFT_12593 [Coemansia reversa NRRL 1564]
MVLGEQFADSHKDIIFERPKIPLAASLADKREVAINRIAAQVPVQAGPTMANYDFVVAPIRYDVIVGLPWIVRNNASVDWDQRIMHTRFGPLEEYCLHPVFMAENTSRQAAEFAQLVRGHPRFDGKVETISVSAWKAVLNSAF